MPRKRLWQILRWLTGIVLGIIALDTINGNRGELTGAFKYLNHLDIFYLLIGIILEIFSVLSYSYLQLKLLRSAGVKAGQPWIAMVSFAALTISASVPAGPAISTLYTFRKYREKKADEIAAGWVILAGFIITAMALAFLASAGAIIAYSESSSYDLFITIISIFVLVDIAFIFFLRRKYVIKFLAGVLYLSHKMFKRPKKDSRIIVEQLRDRVRSINLGKDDLIYLCVAGLGNWAFDCGCLALSFLAVGAGIPWRALLLAYGAGQLAQNLPITPGGLGITEGSLTVALVAFGGSEPTSIAAVLLYRIISFWAYIPLGWCDYLVLRFKENRSQSYKHVANKENIEEIFEIAKVSGEDIYLRKDCVS